MPAKYRFSFGPWNIHEGADPFGPPVRPTVAFGKKLKMYRKLGFEGVQFHDDDAVPDIESKSASQIAAESKKMKRLLDGEGLVPEFVAPRLWENPKGSHGGFTSHDPKVRRWAIDRTKRCLDVADGLGITFSVFWYAREGTYIREAKNAIEAHHHLIESLNELLDYNKTIRIAIEPKPNEPMDHMYIPTVGHALALGQQTIAPDRMGTLIETAHSILAGLDPSDDMAFALSLGKLWSVHLNDQNGLKFDQDKSFGSANLRAAFNQVRILELAHYADTKQFIGLDIKAMRTQPAAVAHKHLANSRAIFLALVDKVRTFNHKQAAQAAKAGDFEELEMMVMKHLMGL